MSKTKIYAHRGASGEYPENTLLSFRKAIEAGVDGIECDIHLTKDEELVVIHDEEVKRTFKGEGFVNDYTLDELRALTLAERYQQFPLYDRSWELEKIPTLEAIYQNHTHCCLISTHHNHPKTKPIAASCRRPKRWLTIVEKLRKDSD